MQKLGFLFLLLFASSSFAQQSDFKYINFSKADRIAKTIKTRRLYKLNKLTYSLTQDLETDVEKLRAIYIWICNNIANDFRLYSLNERKRNKYVKDSIKLQNWNSKFKKILFKKLLKRKRTICTGYAYLLKEMCTIAGIESKMVNGFGRTSTVDFNNLEMPNHTWNVVKLGDKWYLCDPTWSTGISFPEDGRFQFNYNDGYFLSEPKMFIQNHFPLEAKFTLLENNVPTFTEFTELPLVYNDAFLYLKQHLFPNKMHHTLYQNESFTFKYNLKKQVDLKKVKFIVYTSSSERIIKPRIILQNEVLTLNHTFKKRGFFDFHLYIDDKILATYTFKIIKNEKPKINN